MSLDCYQTPAEAPAPGPAPELLPPIGVRPPEEYNLTGEDMRTLSVEWDEQGTRHKEWRKVVQESRNEPPDDFELRGGNAAFFQCRKFLQHGGVFQFGFAHWAREHGVTKRDRTWRELVALVAILWYAGI